MTTDVLGRRALNRATLARQHLLARTDVEPSALIEHLVGLQAQNPLDPYTALWSRLDPFDPDVVGRLLSDRHLVRLLVMRGTIHLVTAADALVLRPFSQPAMDAEIYRHQEFGKDLAAIDLEPVVTVIRDHLAEPRTGPELKAHLLEAFPDHDPAALAFAGRCLLPLVQVPPRGVWGRTKQVTLVDAEAWLGRPLRTDWSREDVLLRYLGALGPATPADFATWSRLTGAAEVIEQIRPRLRTFRDESGRELFDLPEAPRPDPDVPAPVRFLPEYDNVLLGHADRRRFGTDLPPGTFLPDRLFQGAVLVDGRLRASWRVAKAKRKGDPVHLTVRHDARLGSDDMGLVQCEAERLVRFLHPDAAEHRVDLEPVA